MLRRSWRLRVSDMLENLGDIERMTTGLTDETFRSDPQASRAVLRSLSVVSEASRYVPPEIQARHPEIPWRELRGIASVLPMPYMGADLGIIWNGVTEDLPPLAGRLRALLEPHAEDDGHGGGAG